MDARLDTVRTVETPEGVWLALRVAGPIARALAFGIDVAVRVAFYSVVGMVGNIGDAGQGVFLVILFVTEWFYPVLFEVFSDGQTPGKRALSLAVVHEDGRPVRWPGALLRNLLLFADFLPAAYLLGLASMVSSRDFKRLGDHAAGTVVVYRNTPRRGEAAADVQPRAPRAPLTPDEQRALLDYAARSERWSDDRRAELLGHLDGAVAPGESPQAVAAGVAAWLRGKR